MFSLMAFYLKTYFKSLKNYIPLLIIACAIIGYCIMFNITRSEDIPFDIPFDTPFVISFSSPEDGLNEKLKKLEEEGLELLNNKNYDKYYERAIEYLKIGVSVNGNNNIGKDIIKQLKCYEYLQREKVPYIYEGSDNSAFVFMKNLINEPIVIIILISVLLCSAQLFSSEVENKTYKLLYTQPISKTKIYFSKLIFAILINLITIFGIIIICFIYQVITKGMGSPKFLVNSAISSEEALINTTSYITIGKYVFYELGFMIAVVIFVCCIGATVSLLVNNSTASICSSTVFLGLLYVGFKGNSFAAIQKYNPLAYVDINRIMSLGEISSLDLSIGFDPVKLKELYRAGKVGALTNLSLNSGMIVICIGILVLIGINIFIINKKNLAK